MEEKQEQQLYVEKDGIRLILVFPTNEENSEMIQEDVKQVLMIELRRLLQNWETASAEKGEDSI